MSSHQAYAKVGIARCSINVQTNLSTISSLVEGSTPVRSDKFIVHARAANRSFNFTPILLFDLSRSGPHNPACLSFRENFAPRHMRCHRDRAMRRFVFYSVLSVLLSVLLSIPMSVLPYGLQRVPQMYRINLHFEYVTLNDLANDFEVCRPRSCCG